MAGHFLLHYILGVAEIAVDKTVRCNFWAQHKIKHHKKRKKRKNALEWFDFSANEKKIKCKQKKWEN